MPLKKAPPLDLNNNPSIALPPPTTSRTHQRSRTTVDLPPLVTRTSSRSPSHSPSRSSVFLPFFSSSSRSTSPERISVKDAAEFDVGEEEEIAYKANTSSAVKSLAAWFDGSSEPISIGLVSSPAKEQTDPISSDINLTNMHVKTEDNDNLTQRPSRPSSAHPSAAPRFGFFRKHSSVQSSQPIDHEELAQLDIRDALFPSGPPDEYSPASFKNLQLNAEGTLRRFQAGHSDQQRTIRTLSSAKNIQADELEAAQTRNEHLKLQLEEMAERASEQERLIAALRAELSVAAGVPREDIEQDSSIKRVDASDQTFTRNTRWKRVSDISAADSEGGSDVRSIFTDSALGIDSPVRSIAGSSPVMKHANVHYTTVSTPTQDHMAVITVPECQKCHGVRANEAWDVISMMKMESAGLKERIHDLEGANEEALDFLGGLGGLNIHAS